MPQKQHVLLLFQNWHLSSNEAKCIGVGVGEGSGRDRTGELVARGDGVYQGSTGWWRELGLNTDKEGKEGPGGQERNQDHHAWAFQSLKQQFCKRAPTWDTLPLGDDGREDGEGASLWILSSKGSATGGRSMSPSHIRREDGWGVENSGMGMEPRDVRGIIPHCTTHVVKDLQPPSWLGFLCSWYHCEGYLWFVLVTVNKLVWRNTFLGVQEANRMKFLPHLWGQGDWEKILQSISL